jgi:choline dehydrogenase-like flavoprotein
LPGEKFDEAERRTLRLLCDAIVPSVAGNDAARAFYRRKASDLGVDGRVADLVSRSMRPDQRRDFRRFLRVVESRGMNLLLTGRPVRFSALTPEAREAYLKGWGLSRLPVKRRGFHAVKRLTCFLFYAAVGDDGRNRNWPILGYDGPDDAARARYGHPAPLRIEPLRPSEETTLVCDVCVVGSGAGGGVVAATLAEAGHDVVVLEAGGYRTADDFTQREVHATEGMYEGRGLFTSRDLAFGILAARTAGGGTTVNWMTSLPPPDWLRREWEGRGVTGLTDGAFQGCVEEVERRIRVTTEESDVNAANDVLRRGCEVLGYREGVDYHVVPRNALDCRGRCDFCAFGCVYNAKQSGLVTYLPDAYRRGARFLFDTHAKVVAVEGGEAKGVEAVYERDGRAVPVHVKAKVVVAACGAVQTAALLLRSGLRTRGLGRLHIHPTTAVASRFDAPIRMWQGPMQTIMVDRFADLDGRGYGVRLEAVPAHPGLSGLGLPWHGGRRHKEVMRNLAKVCASIVLTRDRGHGKVAVDRRGEPVVHYAMASEDKAHMVRGIQELARIHRAAGAREIVTLHTAYTGVKAANGHIRQTDFDAFLETVARRGIRPNAVALFTAHQMGTAAMGADGVAVCSPRGETHDVRNLFVADGSLFPTPSGVNPMITIMALARRTAGFVESRLAGRG